MESVGHADYSIPRLKRYFVFKKGLFVSVLGLLSVVAADLVTAAAPSVEIYTRNGKGTNQDPAKSNAWFSPRARINGTDGELLGGYTFIWKSKPPMVFLGTDTCCARFFLPEGWKTLTEFTIVLELVTTSRTTIHTQSFWAKEESGDGGGELTLPSNVVAQVSPEIASLGGIFSLTGSASGTVDQWAWLMSNTSTDKGLVVRTTQNASYPAPQYSTNLYFTLEASNSLGTTPSLQVKVETREESDSSTSNTCNDCTTGNSPQVDAGSISETIQGGQVLALNGSCIDRNSYGGAVSPVSRTFLWEIINDQGLTSSGLRIDSADEQSAFLVTPSVDEDKPPIEIRFSCIVNSCPCEDLILVTLNKDAPSQVDARLQYGVGADGGLIDAPEQLVEVYSAVEIILEASGSIGDNLSDANFEWTKQENITSEQGGVVLVKNGMTATLVLSGGTEGTITVIITVTQGSSTSSKSITFNVSASTQQPLAQVQVFVQGREVPEDVPSPIEVAEGVLVVLDGSDSSYPNGSKPNLTFDWQQVGGTPVNLIGLDQDQARFIAPDANGEEGILKLQLTVHDGEISSEPELVEIRVVIAPFYFAQVGVGPVDTEYEFRTVLLLVNNTDQLAENVLVEFTDWTGVPLETTVNEQAWENAPFEIDSLSFARLELRGDTLQEGWACVKSAVELTGLVLFQVVESMSGKVDREVAIFESPSATGFVTYFNRLEQTAAAIANPGEQVATVRLTISDTILGEVKSKLLEIGSREHVTEFLNEDFFGEFLEGFEQGTLVIESDLPVIVTILKTEKGLVWSTTPIGIIRPQFLL